MGAGGAENSSTTRNGQIGRGGGVPVRVDWLGSNGSRTTRPRPAARPPLYSTCQVMYTCRYVLFLLKLTGDGIRMRVIVRRNWFGLLLFITMHLFYFLGWGDYG